MTAIASIIFGTLAGATISPQRRLFLCEIGFHKRLPGLIGRETYRECIHCHRRRWSK